MDRQYTRLDADAAQHALRSPMEDYFYLQDRMQQILAEII